MSRDAQHDPLSNPEPLPNRDPLPDGPRPKRRGWRDPLDTEVLTMWDQARSVAHQLRILKDVRAALKVVKHDADELAAQLDAAAAHAYQRWMRSDQAHGTLKWRHTLSEPLAEEARVWLAHIGLVLKLVGRSPEVAVVRAGVGRPRRSWGQALAAVTEVVRSLDETGLAAHPLLVEPRAVGVGIRDRLSAHGEQLRADQLDDTRLSLARRDARAALLAELRRARTVWAAADKITPGGLVPMDLRISRENLAAVNAAAAARAAPPIGPGDAEGDVQGLNRAEPEGPPPAPVVEVSESGDGEPWVRVEVRRPD